LASGRGEPIHVKQEPKVKLCSEKCVLDYLEKYFPGKHNGLGDILSMEQEEKKLEMEVRESIPSETE